VSAPETAAVGRTTAGRFADWFTPKIALARVAWLRTIVYLFVILDMHAFVRDTRDKGEHPGLYQPLLLARMLDLPKPSVANTSKGQPHGWPFVFLDRDHTIAPRSVL